MKNIELANGSVIGRNHKEIGKNNQDGFSWATNGNVVAGVVCDGCSQGKHSEVGAKLISQMLISEILKIFEKDDILFDVEMSFEFVRSQILTNLKVLVKMMGGNFNKVMLDYFLFTIVGFIVSEKEAVVFSIGDGVIIIDDKIMEIGPFPNNEPPYLAYDLLDSSLVKTDKRLLKFQIQKSMKIDEFNSIIIATDGLKDLIDKQEVNIPGKDETVGLSFQFVDDDKYYKNNDNIRRKLALINKDSVKYKRDIKGSILEIKRENGLLPDDTTIIAIRKRKGGQADGSICE